MGSKKSSKSFQPKWKRATNTLAIASSRAAKLPPTTVEDLTASLLRSMDDLSVVERSAQAWQDLRLACVVSRRVERMGVVKGLSAILKVAFDALEDMRKRCMATGVWRHCSPGEAEMEAVKEMANMHTFQLEHLSVGELQRVVQAARSEIAELPKIDSPAS